MLVRLEIWTKLQNIKSIIGIGSGIIFLHRCRFHYIDHLWIFHGVFISVCLIIVHHGFIIHICGLFVYICAKIILPTGSRQLVSHHLPIMTVLIKKIGLYRKRNTRWSSKSIMSKKMDDWIKIQIWYKIKETSTVEETSASFIDKIASDIEHISNDMAEQWSSSARGKTRKKRLAISQPVWPVPRAVWPVRRPVWPVLRPIWPVCSVNLRVPPRAR